SPVGIHVFIVMLIGAAGNMFQPFSILKIPVNSLAQSFFESDTGLPSQLAVDLGSINGITAVVARPVFYIGNELLTFSLFSSELFVHQLAQQFHQVNISPLIE